jgi:hypothetical protein
MPPDATTITRDGADASSRGRSAGQQERRQDVRERRLVALARDRVRVGERAGVQDEHVEAVVRCGEAGREGGGLREGREVCEVGLDLGACRNGDLPAGAFGPLRVAPDDANVPAQRGDRLGGRSSETRRRPGHDCHLAVEAKRLQRRPVEEAPPDVVADLVKLPTTLASSVQSTSLAASEGVTGSAPSASRAWREPRPD